MTAVIEGDCAKASKPHSILNLGPVDIAGILELLVKLSEKVWEVEDHRKDNPFPCFHHTQHIIFRFIRDNLDPRDFYSKPAWEIWKSQLLPVMTAAVEPYHFTNPVFPKAMLARLEAGQFINTHVDGAGSNLRTHKIHVPIQTNPEALFTSNGETTHLEQGVAYEVNNIAPHSAVNQGPTDRIHFIFEVFDEPQP